MNIAQINAFRASQGLAPLAAPDTNAQKRQQNANKAARAQACRDLKSKRSGPSKKG